MVEKHCSGMDHKCSALPVVVTLPGNAKGFQLRKGCGGLCKRCRVDARGAALAQGQGTDVAGCTVRDREPAAREPCAGAIHQCVVIREVRTTCFAFSHKAYCEQAGAFLALQHVAGAALELLI